MNRINRRIGSISSECASQGQVFHANSGTMVSVLLGMNMCGSVPLLSASHSLFSIWTDLKRSEKIPGVPTRRWGEWIWLTVPSGLYRNSPQGLNQFHQSFWPDQRSGNPNHPSPPMKYNEISSSSSCVLPKGRSFAENSDTKAAIHPKGRSSIANSVLLGMKRCSSFPLLSAPNSLFSI